MNLKVLAIIGTDIGGSVRVPASYCGILGFQPSHDAVCTTGVIPFAQSFETGRNKLIYVSWVKLYIILKCSAKKFNSASESIANAYDIVQIEIIGLYCDATKQFCCLSFSLTSHDHVFLLVSSCESCMH